MALGRAFIEVHADLRPFKKQLANDVGKLLKDTQAAVDKAVKDSVAKANSSSSSIGGNNSPTIKPKLDTSDIDRDSDKVARGLKGAIDKGLKGAAGSIASVFSSPGKTFDQVTLTLIAAAAAAAPFIGAAVAGAIVTGIALAGIGGAVALAFQDTRIKSAAKGLGDFLLDGLTDAAGVFVEPVLTGIQTIKNASVGWISSISQGFRHLAPYVDNLVTGITGFVDKLSDGLTKAFANSGPFLEVFAESLPMIGEALGYMFETLSASEGARAGFLAFLQLAADLIYFVTDVLDLLSTGFEKFVRFLDMMPDSFFPDQVQADITAMVDAMNKVPEPASRATDSILRVGGGASTAASQARDLTASLNAFFGAQLSWVDGNIRFEESIDQITASFKENGVNLDINTAKGRANVSQVNNAIKAAISARDATLKHTGSVSQANAAYSTQIDRLKATLRAAGLTEGQINDLIGAYDDIPPEVNTDVNVHGLGRALSQAQSLARELQSINSQRIQTRRAGSGGAGVGGYADGGIVDREQLAWVGEGNKREAIVPLTNPGRAAEVMAEAGLLGMGGGTMVVQLVLDGKVIDERIVNHNTATARSIRHQPRRI